MIYVKLPDGREFDVVKTFLGYWWSLKNGKEK